jgi:hypothetical protein
MVQLNVDPPLYTICLFRMVRNSFCDYEPVAFFGVYSIVT